jgi:hypothetical protein
MEFVRKGMREESELIFTTNVYVNSELLQRRGAVN